MEGQSLEEDTLSHTRPSSAPGKECSFWGLLGGRGPGSQAWRGDQTVNKAL